MEPTSLFEITRRQNLAGNASGKYAAVAVRGLALGAHASDPLSFAKAEHNTFVGFLTRDVVDALTFTQRVFGVPGATPVGLETPFIAGGEVSIEKAHEIEIEGTEYLYSGTGQITEATTIPQNVSLKEGKWRKTQSGENVNGMLTAVGLTSRGGVGSLRIRIEVCWDMAATDGDAAAPALTIGPTPYSPDLSWTQEIVPATNAIWRSQNGGAFSLLDTQAGGLTTYNDGDSLTSNDYWSYKVIPSAGVESNLADVANLFQPAEAAISYPNLMVVYDLCYLGFFAPGTPVSSINLPALKTISGDLVIDLTGSTLDEVELPALISAGTVAASFLEFQADLFSLPLLATVAGVFSMAAAKVTTASFPALTTIGGALEMVGHEIGTLNMPSLTSIGGDLLSPGGVVMTSLSLPALTTITGNITCTSWSVLTTVNFPALVMNDGQVIDFSGCALSAASVNHVLARAVASGITGATIFLDAGTNAAPTGQGIVDKAALITAGNTVDTN